MSVIRPIVPRKIVVHHGRGVRHVATCGQKPPMSFCTDDWPCVTCGNCLRIRYAAMAREQQREPELDDRQQTRLFPRTEG